MPRNADAEYDQRLRDCLEPEPATVDRLVRTALSRAARPPLSRRWLYPGALVMAAAVAAVLLFMHFINSGPENQDRLGMEGAGEVVLLLAPSGESWILGSGESAISLPPGTGLVIIEGDIK
jgi:hypothetical protein